MDTESSAPAENVGSAGNQTSAMGSMAELQDPSALSAAPSGIDASVGDELRSIQEKLQEQVQASPSVSSGSGDAGAVRNFKEMLESVKKLGSTADTLQDRICRLHCGYADLILKGAFLFDPETIELMKFEPEPGAFQDPTDVHFMRKMVDENYDTLMAQVDAWSPAPGHVDDSAKLN